MLCIFESCAWLKQSWKQSRSHTLQHSLKGSLGHVGTWNNLLLLWPTFWFKGLQAATRKQEIWGNIAHPKQSFLQHCTAVQALPLCTLLRLLTYVINNSQWKGHLCQAVLELWKYCFKRIYSVNTQLTTHLSFFKSIFQIRAQELVFMLTHLFWHSICSSFCILLKQIKLWKINQTLPDRSKRVFVHLKSAFLQDAELEHQGAREQTSVYVLRSSTLTSARRLT